MMKRIVVRRNLSLAREAASGAPRQNRLWVVFSVLCASSLRGPLNSQSGKPRAIARW